MSNNRTEIELRRFYERWAPFVATFCKLYLGDSQTAEAAVARTFLKYFRSELPLRRDHVPAALMSLALEESNCAGGGTGSEAGSAFEWAVLELPPDKRAVFLLHGLLDLHLASIAAITGSPFATVSQLWICALVQLRMSIVRDGCSRLFACCGPGPLGAAGACA